MNRLSERIDDIVSMRETQAELAELLQSGQTMNAVSCPHLH